MPEIVSVMSGNTSGPRECTAVTVCCSVEFDEDSPLPENPEIVLRAIESAVATCHEALRDDGPRRS